MNLVIWFLFSIFCNHDNERPSWESKYVFILDNPSTIKDIYNIYDIVHDLKFLKLHECNNIFKKYFNNGCRKNFR